MQNYILTILFIYLPISVQSAQAVDILFSDHFSDMPNGVCFNEGQAFGSWVSVFNGFGCNSVEKFARENVLSQRTKSPVSRAETHGSLVIGPNFSSPFRLQASMMTALQLRKGSPANPWEVGWIIWNYADRRHFYYFVLKPNGWELGKEDPAYPGGQRFLATGSRPVFPIGRWNKITISQYFNSVSVQVNGELIASVSDAQFPYIAGNIGLYCEDSQADFHSISVSRP